MISLEEMEAIKIHYQVQNSVALNRELGGAKPKFLFLSTRVTLVFSLFILLLYLYMGS